MTIKDLCLGCKKEIQTLVLPKDEQEKKYRHYRIKEPRTIICPNCGYPNNLILAATLTANK
jgi:DNA-directed RNA polymerase subunit RPC12/RpoP